MEGNRLDGTSEYALKNMVSYNCRICILKLGQCRLGDNAAIGLLKGLLKNTVMETVKLQGNGLTDKISEYLNDLIISNRAYLKSLDLSQNQLTDLTGETLATYLRVNTNLTSLNLQGNMLMSSSGSAFQDALTVNKSLTKLKLRFNFIKY